jgi:hypothetical protein
MMGIGQAKKKAEKALSSLITVCSPLALWKRAKERIMVEESLNFQD